MFVAKQNDGELIVEAKKAEKSVVYCCRDCRELVILVRPKVRRFHFRHRANSNCTSAGETWQHADAKGTILDSLRARKIESFPEVECLTIEGDRRADVLAWVPVGDSRESHLERRMAFEVQFSQISDEGLNQRTSAYMSARVPVVWIPVVNQSKFGTAFRLKSDPRFHKCNNVQLPIWIDRIRDIQNELWIYVPQSKAFFKMWNLTCYRYIERNDYHNSNGEECSSGGYWKAYERLGDIILYGPVAFEELKIQRVWQNNNKSILSNSGWKRLVKLVDPKLADAQKCPIDRRFIETEDSRFSIPRDFCFHDGEEISPKFEEITSFPCLVR